MVYNKVKIAEPLYIAHSRELALLEDVHSCRKYSKNPVHPAVILFEQEL